MEMTKTMVQVTTTKKRSGEINHEQLNDEGQNKQVETPDTEAVTGQLDNMSEKKVKKNRQMSIIVKIQTIK